MLYSRIRTNAGGAVNPKRKGQRGEALPYDLIEWTVGSDDAATSGHAGRTFLADPLAIAALAIGGDRIDRTG
jgi:hypothetical protein